MFPSRYLSCGMIMAIRSYTCSHQVPSERPRSKSTHPSSHRHQPSRILLWDTKTAEEAVGEVVMAGINNLWIVLARIHTPAGRSLRSAWIISVTVKEAQAQGSGVGPLMDHRKNCISTSPLISTAICPLLTPTAYQSKTLANLS